MLINAELSFVSPSSFYSWHSNRAGPRGDGVEACSRRCISSPEKPEPVVGVGRVRCPASCDGLHYIMCASSTVRVRCLRACMALTQVYFSRLRGAWLPVTCKSRRTDDCDATALCLHGVRSQAFVDNLKVKQLHHKIFVNFVHTGFLLATYHRDSTNLSMA